MNSSIYFIFIAFIVAGNAHNVVAMQSQEALVKQKFYGQELTALAIIERSNEKKDSLNFMAQKKIIAIFNYEKQDVIIFIGEENHCRFSYQKFSEIMKEKWQSEEFSTFQKESDKQTSELDKAFADSCACCIS